MREFLIGVFGAFIIFALLEFFKHYVFEFYISDFLSGWICCIGYFVFKDAYTELNSESKI
jgi:hypothetical protein